MMISVILLAAGSSRRMGMVNKLLLPYKGMTMVGWVCDRLLGARVGEIVVVLGHEADRVRGVLEQREGLRFVVNTDYATGMTGSIQVGIRASDEGSDGYMICLSDMPLLGSVDYSFLVEQFTAFYGENEEVIVRPVCGGKVGNPVVFAGGYREVLLTHDEPEGCRGVIVANKGNLKMVEMGEGVLRDVDTEGDFEVLRY